MICKNCGVKVPDGKIKCAVCGTPVSSVSNPQPPAHNSQGSFGFAPAGSILSPSMPPKPTPQTNVDIPKNPNYSTEAYPPPTAVNVTYTPPVYTQPVYAQPTIVPATPPTLSEAPKPAKSKHQLFTTKGTNWFNLTCYIISIFLSIGAMLYIAWLLYEMLKPYPVYIRNLYWEKEGGKTVFYYIWLIFLLFYSILELSGCRSYVNVYEDRMEGRGIQGFYQIMDFSLKYDKIVNVTRKFSFLYIHTNNGKYKIYTNSKTAKKIFAYYSEREYE